MARIQLAPWQLSLAATVFIVGVNNGKLFAAFGHELDLLSAQGIGFALSITLLAALFVNSLLLTFGIGRLLRPLIAVLLLATSVFAYFSNEMGVIFHEEMFLNVFETVRDNNSAEAAELLSPPLLAHIALTGLLPSLLLGLVDTVPRPFFREAGARILVTMALLALFVGITVPNFKYVTYFAVEHRDLRFTVMPVFPILSLLRLGQDQLHHEPPFRVIDANARQRMVSANRTVGIMVVGETARADHFSLNGYSKDTNPLLEQDDDVLFTHGRSCGTSTLHSVPCMFSIKGRDNYEESDAKSQSNVLDILSAAGVRTIWIDNNSSCKHACDRIENINLRQALDKSSPYFSDKGYFDEILLDKIDGYLTEEGPDLLIVLHTLGSHGPAYSRRYPAAFGIFAPYCDKSSPKECSDDLVSNAYDNTILYTDYILSRLIEKLDDKKDRINGFVFYASDHGESLGENGIYLHGLPYALAPEAQKDVPFIVWLSPGFRQSRSIDAAAVGHFSMERVSHDNISHTLMGFYDVNAMSYQQELDLFAPPSRHDFAGSELSSFRSTLSAPLAVQSGP